MRRELAWCRWFFGSVQASEVASPLLQMDSPVQDAAQRAEMFSGLIIVAVSSQVASFSHLLQSDLSASISEQEGTQSETDHRHLQL